MVEGLWHGAEGTAHSAKADDRWLNFRFLDAGHRLLNLIYSGQMNSVILLLKSDFTVRSKL